MAERASERESGMRGMVDECENSACECDAQVFAMRWNDLSDGNEESCKKGKKTKTCLVG